MACCRCNHQGLCKGCACVEAGRLCVNCWPIRLGVCQNVAGCSASAAQTNDKQQTATHVNDLLLQMEEEISQVACVNNRVPLPTLNADSTLVTGMSSASSACPNADTSIPSLPPYSPMASTVFSWDNYSGDKFLHLLNQYYNGAVHWRRNLF